jgi:polysaccharide deacetylase 2 family uncharacterized protein YibQ
MAKNRGRAKWILLALAVIALIVYINPFEKATRETGAPKQLYNVEKTGAGVVVDYSATAQKIHGAVDGVLAGLSSQVVQDGAREVPRQKVEGTIKWHARQLVVGVAEDAKMESLQQDLAQAIKTSGGEVLASQPDNYQGKPAVRLDVGIRDSLEGEPLTITTDKIYIIKQKKGESLPAKPAVTGKGQMAIIIDDFGYSGDPIGAFAAIQRPLTFSVLPFRPYTNEAASRGLSSGHQVMLHLPMEPLSAAQQSEASTITVGMSDQEIQQAVTKAIQAVPGIIGVNNHQGSRATADRRVMKTVLGVVKANSLFFVDSRTNGQSVAYDMAMQMGVGTGENALFLDNSSDVGSIKARLRDAIQLAIQHGNVMVIGHARMNTATAVREMIPEIEAAGVKLVFASQILR